MELILEDEKAYKNFAILASACCVYMGYSWELDERRSCNPHWDERKSAAQEFCNANYKTFADIFISYTGLNVPSGENCKYESFFRDWTIDKRVALYHELSDFANEHSTIQQKIIGTFIRTLAKKEVNLSEYH